MDWIGLDGTGYDHLWMRRRLADKSVTPRQVAA